MPSNFIHTKRIDGVWWFINADGAPFVSLGVNHIEPHLWLAPYNKQATLDRYGADMVDENGCFNTHGNAAKQWIDRQVKVCRSLHFNTFAKHTHPSIDPALYKDQVCYIASLETAPLAGWRERRGEGPRPDLFSADFRSFVEKRAEQVCAEHRDSRNLIGYLYVDIPAWKLGRGEQQEQNAGAMVYPWLNAILSLGESSPGKWRWLEHLQQRYPDAVAAARVWGLPTSSTYGISWERMARLVDWFHPADEAKAGDDMLSFMSVIADQWYGMHRQIVLRHDPNHLLLGDKNMVDWHYDWILPALSEHVDVVATQAYGRWSDDAAGHRRIHEATGKPLFNGDGSFGFAQPNQRECGVKGFRTGAKSIAEVAELYREMVEGMMAAPYMIGWHHCGYLEQWDECERGDAPSNENGFMNPFEEFHTEWADVIREMNGKAAELHRNAGTSN